MPGVRTLPASSWLTKTDMDNDTTKTGTPNLDPTSGEPGRGTRSAPALALALRRAEWEKAKMDARRLGPHRRSLR